MDFTEAYVCNMGRTQQLNSRINNRIYPSSKLPVSFDVRPVQTKHVLFPILDCRKKPMVQVENRGFFDDSQTFSPGDSAPFNGYMKKIDDESKLKNIVFPNQKSVQSKFIPGSNSDLFRNDMYTVGRNEYNPYPGLFKEENFRPVIPCNTRQIGFETFNNHTRQQTKNLK
jgi:hypothetical protein